jgi:hypothetical protein
MESLLVVQKSGLTKCRAAERCPRSDFLEPRLRPVPGLRNQVDSFLESDLSTLRSLGRHLRERPPARMK